MSRGQVEGRTLPSASAKSAAPPPLAQTTQAVPAAVADALPVATQWPKYPYRGLDFYRETDTLLFREREKDVRECADILLGFGVKILILQGSSGSGKSSFLRAGLIPQLKREARPNFFLSDRNAVVRCTSDPLPEIARSLIGALDDRQMF
jgi:hypothetical protein